MTFLVLMIVACGSAHPQSDEGEPWKRDANIVFLHRGARLEAPEGTLPAYEAALRQGADGIEVDLRRTLDGVLVNYHDETTYLHGGGYLPVEQMSYAEFLELDLGFRFSPRFAGVRGPRFEEILRYCLAQGLYLRIDLKDPAILGDVVKLLDSHDAWGLLGSSVDGALSAREALRSPWLTEGDLWMKGGDEDPDRLRERVDGHRGAFRVTLDDARAMSRVLGRKPSLRQERPWSRAGVDVPPKLRAAGVPAAVRRALASSSSTNDVKEALCFLRRAAPTEVLGPVVTELLDRDLPAGGKVEEALCHLIGRRRLSRFVPELLRRAAHQPSACWALGWLKVGEANKPLSAVLRAHLGGQDEAPTEAVALQAALALGRLGARDAVPLLARGLQAKPSLALCCLVALGDLPCSSSTKVLGQALLEPRLARLPQWAINTVCVQLARHGDAAVPWFMKALPRPEPLIRREVILTLPRLGAVARRALQESPLPSARLALSFFRAH